MSRDEAGETSEWGQVMKNIIRHGQELGLDPEHDEMPLGGFTQGSTGQISVWDG